MIRHESSEASVLVFPDEQQFEPERETSALARSIDQLTESSQDRVIPTRHYFSGRIEDVQTFVTRRYDQSDITEVFDIIDTYTPGNKSEAYHGRLYAVRILDDPRGEFLVTFDESQTKVRYKQGESWQTISDETAGEIASELEHRVSDAISWANSRSDSEKTAADLDALVLLKSSDRFCAQHLPEVDRSINRLSASSNIGAVALQTVNKPPMLQSV